MMNELPSQTPAANIVYDVRLVGNVMLLNLAPPHATMLLEAYQTHPAIVSLEPFMLPNVRDANKRQIATNVPAIYLGTDAQYDEPNHHLIVWKGKRSVEYAVSHPFLCYNENGMDILHSHNAREYREPANAIRSVTGSYVAPEDQQFFLQQQGTVYDESKKTITYFSETMGHLGALAARISNDAEQRKKPKPFLPPKDQLGGQSSN